jgi:hypothetical protein
MPSSYTANLGLEKPATGEQEGVWGGTVNTNYDISDSAINGFTTLSLSTAGTPGTPNQITVNKGAITDATYPYIIVSDTGDFGNVAYLQLSDERGTWDNKKIAYIKNNMSNTQDELHVFMGNHDAAREYVIEYGRTALVLFNGGGLNASFVTPILNDMQYAGGIFLDNNEPITWRNAGDTDDATAKVDTNDDFVFTLNGTDEIRHDSSASAWKLLVNDLILNTGQKIYWGGSSDSFIQGFTTTGAIYYDSISGSSPMHRFRIDSVDVAVIDATDVNFQGLNFVTTGTLGAGAITATSYDGITAANLVDKSAVETISGTWTFGTINATTISGIATSNLVDKSAAETITQPWTFNDDIVIGTEGKGIDFSAVTNSAITGVTTTSEVLDAYQEGVWTPVISDGTTEAAMSSSSTGSWTRMGRVVHFEFICATTSISGLSGTIRINGLPFPAAATPASRGGGMAIHHSNIGLSDMTGISVRPIQAATYLRAYMHRTGQIITTIGNSTWENDSSIEVIGHYRI